MDKESNFIDCTDEPLEELSFAERVERDTIDNMSEIAEKWNERQAATAKTTSSRQRIVIKKLLCGSNHIREVGMDDDDAVKIPDGWNVKQITTTPIEKGGATTHLALTMLLEKAD